MSLLTEPGYVDTTDGAKRSALSTVHPRPHSEAVHRAVPTLDGRPVAWLHAGEALSAAWLTATEHSVSVLPLSAVVEVGTTRVVLRRLLARLGEPFLILRLGPPRLKVAQIVGEAGPTPQ